MTAAVPAVAGLVAATAKKSSGSSATILIVYAAIAVAFYFFFWRPRQKRAQAAREVAVGYEVGDEVLTAGGIVGHIIDIQGERFTLETSVGASFVVLKQYVIRKMVADEPEAEPEDEGFLESPAGVVEAGEDEDEDGSEHEADDEGGTDEDVAEHDTADEVDEQDDAGTGGDPATNGGSGAGKAAKRRGRGRKDGPQSGGPDAPPII